MYKKLRDLPAPQGLYDPAFEHDACGIGFVVNMKGKKSYDIIDQALTILENLKHRGAEGADAQSGDGAGILVQIPHQFFCRECDVLGFTLPPEGEYGVGMIFAHRYETFRKKQMEEFEKIVNEEGLSILGWRDVPVDESLIGSIAKTIRPHFLQVFIRKDPALTNPMDFERKLYIIRKMAEKKIIPASQEKGSDFYIASLSSRTIVYKGMLTSIQLRHFYLDLSDLDFTTSMALVHSRFSTNTFPSWARAHPNRYIVHNGEINTIQGNVNWLNARESKSKSSDFPDLEKVFPVVDDSGSDSAMFDNCLEYLYMTGHSLPHAMMMMIPEPWEKDPLMSKEKRDFYRYHNFMIEPWDGPAAIGFCDGIVIGGMLDRNGLRPARYYVTRDDRVIASSEVGALSIPPEEVLYKGRLQPGKMLLVDTQQQRIIDDEEIKQQIATEFPYGEWYKKHVIDLDDLMSRQNLIGSDKTIPYDLKEQEMVFGYTQEDMDKIILPMARDGKQPIDSMGMDVSLPVLSDRPQLLYDYFQENFAQVTNPPIDGVRENIVMSSLVMAGNVANIMDPDDENTAALYLKRPILTNEEMAVIKSLMTDKLHTSVISMLYPVGGGPDAMETAIESLCIDALKAIRNGANILILSDRGINSRMAAIPALLATAALHHFLIRKTVRSDVGLILESGEPREIHHFCTLVGYGITAVNPYVALESIKELAAKKKLGKISCEEARENYIRAAVNGMLAVMSKMGISTIHSYHGAQIFEAVGISRDLIQKYFVNTPSPIGGIGLTEIARENALRHEAAFSGSDTLPKGDIYQYHKGGQAHIIDPQAVQLLQKSCRTNDYDLYREYADRVNTSSTYRLRDLLEFVYPAGCSIPIEEVESEDNIVKRFRTGAMSYGALSKEAHECVARAMNRLGGMSNTGEGGEDAARFDTDTNDKIKQVASARFGVTSNYLVHAAELQIKCAQGAKPGEGGHLPGSKVYPDIAKTRHATTGVALISPPPHHDVYSIEDLAELIFDLKNANRNARIGVKLTSGAGIGTIAAGVVKAKADELTISGFDGGTGASPRTSLRHAGLPWEIGLSEVQQTLLLNQLRDRVRVEVDGKLLTGRDVAIAALFGAELFGFGTAPLMAIGCHMLRVCHLNTCPYGVCTQNEKLRKNFKGKPEYIINFMHFIARDLREIMARLGFHKIDDMVGRYDLLKQKDAAPNWKAATVNLKQLLYRPYTDIHIGHHFTTPQDHEISKTLDMSKLVRMCRPALEQKKHIRARLRIKNTDRVTGTLLGSEITRRYGEEGLTEDTIKLCFVGSAGQSFGAFIPRGLTLELEGDANDYLGKGLSGGKIIVHPPVESVFPAEDNIIIGNVAFYGATSGEAYINGIAGERFCVRNSGITAVVEGVGNHGCEYMTGGRVLVLGRTGRNFAAGMSGGIAYVYDLEPTNCNQDLVHLGDLTDEGEVSIVKDMLARHVQYTGSELGRRLLENWEDTQGRITRIIPTAYEEMLALIEKAKAEGHTDKEAHMIAFQTKHGK
ncbi:glutamate synthase large subunit [Megasphaera sp. AM44-1BH]|uniref:glutamate synthase large subunit n=1 Tax=Megasphaera sp. AM44-1BH TaxID=2292358 RepID=UPI000E52D6C0|nr:glutamate synthase large subunit [Megasphaera sp. AM44-1BH]RHA13350.1 glutamate synthase large subunit [Megasphaera sp. AM44-1BH]